MQFSRFGEKFTSRSGILSLMDDLGEAVAEGNTLMLGGGNPGHIPEVVEHFRARLNAILGEAGGLERMVGSYDPPDGNREFREALAALLEREFGWQISYRNIALTNGSQSAFFMLFNLFAGDMPDGTRKKILLPLAPEYIGYADAGLTPDFFVAAKPSFEYLEPHIFKYRVDFDALEIDESIAAMCVSRPTNPTGNVLTDEEISRLEALTAEHDIPLILDNAYGTPFPNIIFTDAKPRWTDKTIVCMSLSKLGLPGVRTGIVIAPETVVEALSGINAILNLAPGNFGAQLAMDLVKSGDILDISRRLVRPFYEKRAHDAIRVLTTELGDVDFYIHKPEGAIFLWLWFKDLPITSAELYERLKNRGVLIISGHHFFPGIAEPWVHKNECIRVTCSQDWPSVEQGLKIIAAEAKRAYAQSG